MKNKLEYIDAEKFIEYIKNNFNIQIKDNWMRTGKEYIEGSNYQIDFSSDDINNSRSLYILMKNKKYLLQINNAIIILTKIKANSSHIEYIIDHFKIIIE